MLFDRKKFFDGFRKWQGSLEPEQVSGLNYLLAGIENDSHIKLVSWAAYYLATAWHETAHSFQPVEEGYYLGSKAKAFQKKLRYYPYFGRGYVQLTWATNYKSLTTALKKEYPNLVDSFEKRTKSSFDLEKYPEQALDAEIAFAVMAYGMRTGKFGKKLGDYLTSSKTDYKNARRTVNVMDKAALIAGYATKFEAILKDAFVRFPDAVSTDTRESAKVTLPQKEIEAPLIPASSSVASEPDATTPAQTPKPEPESIATEQTVKTETATHQGTETVETKVEVQQQIAIEKPKPQNFLSKIWKKITGLFGGAAITDVITEKAAQANTLGLSPETWKRIFWLALFAGLAYLIYELFDHLSSMKRDKEITNELIKANTTDNNIVQLVDADNLQTLKDKGYEIVKR